MVHTAVPYASFTSASDHANSEGGLWDVFNGDGLPGFFEDKVLMPPMDGEPYIAFSGEVYGDVDVNTLGEPGTILSFFWSFQACWASNETVITTSVGSTSYVDTLLNCVSHLSLSLIAHSGTAQVNSEGNIRILLASPYSGQDLQDANVYISGFKLELIPEPSNSSSFVIGNSLTTETPPHPITSTNQHFSQTLTVDTVATNYTSLPPSTTGPHILSITIPSQSHLGSSYTQASSVDVASTALPHSNRASSSSHSDVSLIVGVTLTGLAVLTLLAFLSWRYKYLWSRWKTGGEQSLYLQGEKFSNSSRREHNITKIGGGELELGHTATRYGYGWGQDGFPTADACALEVSDKSRGGIPPPFPLTDSKEKRRLDAYSDA